MTNWQPLFAGRRGEGRTGLVGEAYAAIKDAIRTGLFPPGFQGSELEIAQRLGMSRTPVHQAIIRLQGEGMVDLRPKRGVVIRALSPIDMREVYDVIIAVEGMAALLAAETPQKERAAACARLSAINRQIEGALERNDLTAWADLDGAFHAELVKAGGNGRLNGIAETNIDQSYRARRLTLRLRPKPMHSISEHDAIVDAIAEGNGEGARRAAQEHKSRARDLILTLLERYNINHL